jgi:hypothetical protein
VAVREVDSLLPTFRIIGILPPRPHAHVGQTRVQL